MRFNLRLERVLHVGAVLGWTITAGLLLGYVAPCVWVLRVNLGTDLLFGRGEHLPVWLIVAVWLVVAAAGGVAIWRRLRWALVLGALAVNLAAMVYLRWDATEPCPLPELGQLRDEADLRWDTLAWMMEKHPKSRTGEALLKPDAALAIRLPSERDAWAEHVRTHRQAIIDAWEADALGREWIDELCRCPPQGIHLYRHDDPMLSFMRVRASLHARMSFAYLRATEGDRDEAIRLVLPELIAWQHLQRCEAMLVHQMMAVVMIKESLKTIAGILDLGAVEMVTVAELRDALNSSLPLGEVFRLGFLGDYVYSRSFETDLDSAMTQEGSKLFLGMLGLDDAPLVFQSRVFGFKWLLQKERWRHEYLAAMTRVVSLATARDLVTLKQESDAADHRWAVRNALGVRFMGMAMPAFAKVAEQIWVMEDARVALRQRVNSLHAAERAPTP